MFFSPWILVQDSIFLRHTSNNQMATPLPQCQLTEVLQKLKTLESCLGISKPKIQILYREMKRADKLPQVFSFYLENRLMARFLFQSHIEIIRGHAAFTSDPKPTVEVNGKKYTAPHILIATGGVPSRPQESEIPGESSEGKCLLLTVKGHLLLSSTL